MKKLDELHQSNEDFEKINDKDKRRHKLQKFRENVSLLMQNSPDDIFSQYDMITSLIHVNRHR